MKNLIVATVLFYIVGLLVFTTLSRFEFNNWANIYYIWDKCKDAMLFLVLGLIVRPPLKKLLLYPMMYSLVRLVWEIVATVMKVEVNTRQAVNVLFMVLMVIILIILFKDLQKWKRSN